MLKTASHWDTATGEVVIRCDAQTAHEVISALEQTINKQLPGPTKELVLFYRAVSHTVMHPNPMGTKP